MHAGLQPKLPQDAFIQALTEPKPVSAKPRYKLPGERWVLSLQEPKYEVVFQEEDMRTERNDWQRTLFGLINILFSVDKLDNDNDRAVDKYREYILVIYRKV